MYKYIVHYLTKFNEIHAYANTCIREYIFQTYLTMEQGVYDCMLYIFQFFFFDDWGGIK